MGGSTSSKLLEPSSQISTNFQCDNCHVTIDQVSWKQCNKCQSFDLCDLCSIIHYHKLIPVAITNHNKYHEKMKLNEVKPDEDITQISIVDAETYANQDLHLRIENEFKRIVKQKQIGSDYDMSIIMQMFNKNENLALTVSTPDEKKASDINSMIAAYHIQASLTNIRILTIDGGGIRGYMPIKVLSELIIKEYLSDIEHFDRTNCEHQQRFQQGQSKFVDQFDYISGTSTGGLIAFCLAVNHSILDIQQIYEDSSFYFKRNRLGPYLWDKYDPVHIHHQIDQIINEIKWTNHRQVTAENATLLDVHNLLNPHHFITEEMLTGDKLGETLLAHGNWLEFFDPLSQNDFHKTNQSEIRSYVQREKVLLITSYNTTTDTMTVFNTSYAKHWPYRIADVLKATMAAPTYFPPQHIHKTILQHGQFVQDPNRHQISPEIFVDGGVFANDPELVTLWAIRMQWKKLVNYHLLSIGTGCYNAKLSPRTAGGYPGWIRTDGLAINILMDATRSSTEIIANNLAKFNNIRRMKFNYRLLESMSLDDSNFIQRFNQEWETLKNGDDFKAFVYFYNTYIKQNKHQT